MPRKLPKMKTPIEIKQEEEKKITFSDRWEEELKKQLFEEEQKSEEEMTVDDVLYSKTTVHKKRPGEEWDVPLSEEIQYFDSELSYELTGYRPITMEQGLDFDPEPFREMANIYNSTGSYTQYPPGRKLYNDLWDREYDRCENGLTIGKYRLTGDHYFFLNYYRMDVINESAIAGAGRTEAFPTFLSKQYEWFHYVEMAEKLHEDACALKARGVNFTCPTH